MTLIGFLVLLAVAAVCGALGQAIAGYTAGGCFLSIGIGLVGAVLGFWLADRLDLPELFVVDVEGQPFPIAWSILGSALFSLLLGMFSRRKAKK